MSRVFSPSRSLTQATQPTFDATVECEALPLSDPHRFAAAWAQAWNEHDIEANLARCHVDVELQSPVAARRLFDPAGKVVGQAALRAFWSTTIERVPDYKLRIISLFVGIGVLVIHYRNRDDFPACEILKFDGQLVREVWSCFPRD